MTPSDSSRPASTKKEPAKKKTRRGTNIVVVVMAMLLYADLFAQPACGGPEATAAPPQRGLPGRRPHSNVDASAGLDGAVPVDASVKVDGGIMPDAAVKLDAGSPVDASPDA